MQVASHAQKHFLKPNSESKKNKRLSIHDMSLGDAKNVTVPVSNSNSMGQQQPHFGEKIPPDQLYDYLHEYLGIFGDYDDGFEELFKA